MPKTNSKVQHFSQSVRFVRDEAEWIKTEATLGGSFAAVVRECANDLRMLYLLPGLMVEVLDEDAKRVCRGIPSLNVETMSLGMIRRAYIKQLLALRYDELRREEQKREEQKREEQKREEAAKKEEEGSKRAAK